MNKNYNLETRDSIAEKDFLSSLSNSELFHLILSFQNEKRRYFKKYIILLEKEIESLSEENRLMINQERNQIWTQHLHYEEMVQWALQESIKRSKPKK